MSYVLESRIRRMNEIFQLPCNDRLVDQGNDRIDAFHGVIHEEVSEIFDILQIEDQDERFVAMSDVLADIMVYCMSEARRWGIPITQVLHAVLDSQDSKLVDGKPLMSEDGSKFIKGPNYVAPEAKIAELLKAYK